MEKVNISKDAIHNPSLAKRSKERFYITPEASSALLKSSPLNPLDKLGFKEGVISDKNCQV